ncbi:MAG: lamin tail domain-containing protein [Micromonosporaceae bacterium]
MNAEYITLKNVTSGAAVLTGWTIRDRANHVYKFGTYTLGAGRYVTIHTGKGTNTTSHRYWNRSWYVWNNTGDKAYLRMPGGSLKDTCEWGSSGSYKIC